VFENKLLRRIFGPKWDEVTVERKKVHNEELSDLYCSPNILGDDQIEKSELAGHVARLGESRSVDRVLVGKPEGKKTTWKTLA
jgi:hypothetical protein